MFLKTRENILLLKLVSDVTWILAFLVQGAVSGTIAMTFTMLRTFSGGISLRSNRSAFSCG